MENNSTDQSQKGKEVFMTMVGLLGLNAEVKDKVSGRNIILSVNTDEPGRLIGRNGSSLDNVGLLMNRILKKTDNTFPKVIIDVDGYDKKSKRDKRDKRRNNNRRDKKARSSKMEKTAVMDEVTGEEKINVYVDHETDSLAPVTTVALDAPAETSPQQRGNRRDNRGRRDNNRGRRDNNRGRRDNNRSDNRNRNNDDRPQRQPKADKPQEAAQATAEQPKAPAPAEQSKAPADKGGKPQNKIQMQCRNAAKEVKRWGEDILLPPQSEADCQKALEYFGKDKELISSIDNSRSYGDKKRVRISLKK